jgi:hypothetical protein
MPLPFDTWTLEQAKKAAAIGDNIKPLVTQAMKFYDGDHWQGGEGWIGPAPVQGEEGQAETLTLIERAFVSRNVIKEIVDRHTRGVVGHEPAWRFTPRRPMEDDEDPTQAEQTDIDAIEASLTEWWDARKIPDTLSAAVTALLQAQRSHLRLFVPKGLLVEQTREVAAQDGTTTTVKSSGVTVNSKDGIGGGLAWLFLDHPIPTAAAVYTDPETQQSVGIVVYKPNEGAVDKQEGPETAELTYLNESGQTVIRTVTSDTAQGKSFTFDLGGRITIFEMDREPLITKQLTQGQKALNLALSMLPRNVVTGGFIERVLLNAQMPGYWVDENGVRTTDINARKKFVTLPYKAGAGTTNFVRGFDYKDVKTGEQKLTDPQIQWREPAPVTAPVEAKRSHYQDMLEEADQTHVLLAAEATPSGRSREEARADYVSSLSDTRKTIEECGRWLLETALALAEMFNGKPNVLGAQYRCDFSCKLNAGPISETERAANETSVEKRTMTRETAMERSGILDVDAEIAKINEEPGAQLAFLKSQLEVMKIATDTGMSLAGAAKLVGMEADQVKIIEEDEGATDPNAPENGAVPAAEADPNAPPAPKPALAA